MDKSNDQEVEYLSDIKWLMRIEKFIYNNSAHFFALSILFSFWFFEATNIKYKLIYSIAALSLTICNNRHLIRKNGIRSNIVRLTMPVIMSFNVISSFIIKWSDDGGTAHIIIEMVNIGIFIPYILLLAENLIKRQNITNNELSFPFWMMITFYSVSITLPLTPNILSLLNEENMNGLMIIGISLWLIIIFLEKKDNDRFNHSIRIINKISLIVFVIYLNQDIVSFMSNNNDNYIVFFTAFIYLFTYIIFYWSAVKKDQ